MDSRSELPAPLPLPPKPRLSRLPEVVLAILFVAGAAFFFLVTKPQPKSTIYLGYWKPTKLVWYPGDRVDFEFQRYTLLHGARMLTIDIAAAWVDDLEGKSYEALGGDTRHLKREGMSNGLRTRKLPDDIPTGRFYHLEGHSETVTSRPAEISPFESESIFVAKKPKSDADAAR